jgi:hypothetical protein
LTIIRHVDKYGGKLQQLAKRLLHRFVVRAQHRDVGVGGVILDDGERLVAIKHFKRNLKNSVMVRAEAVVSASSAATCSRAAALREAASRWHLLPTWATSMKACSYLRGGG